MIIISAIITRGLSKKYGKIAAVSDFNIEIDEGELFALLGTNGAGKTTVLKMLSSLIRESSGEAFILGLDMKKSASKIRELINVSPQNTAIAGNLTVWENLDFMAGVYKIGDKKARIAELIEEFSLSSVLHRRARTLSGGWQRRISIALSLINRPKILFLDEPTLGLDIIAREELWNLIRALHGKTTIILTTHYMEEAEALADRIGIMSHSRLVAIGTAEELIASSGAESFSRAFIKLCGGDEI